MDRTTKPNKYLARIEHLEENRRFIQNALEMALTLGDFQKNIQRESNIVSILHESEKRIRKLMPFDMRAFYVVRPEDSDFALTVCHPVELEKNMEEEVEFMVDKGFFAWALREKRGVFIESRDHSALYLLHVIATHSRIRGMFVGLVRDMRQSIPDASLTLLTIILHNTANAMESVEFYNFLHDQKRLLEMEVREKSKELIRNEIERLNLLNQLQQIQKMEAIGALAGGIAHDFNNILVPIIGFTEMSLDDVPHDNPIRENLTEILKAAKRARDLVRQILTFSRQGERELKPLRMQSVIKEVAKLARSTLPATIEITRKIDENCFPVMADVTCIHQIAMNLLTNAFHAMEKSTQGRLEIALFNTQLTYDDLNDPELGPGNYVCLSVSDTGDGIESGILEKIFDPYFTTKEPGKGTGLGLSVVHGIVKSHRGTIMVHSRPGQGSVFKVYLPGIETAFDENGKTSDTDIPTGDETILLVDDEKLALKTLKNMLERLGYRVVDKNGSIEALEAFLTAPDSFDLVVTDMTMPKMTGDRLAKRLLEERPDLPIILCTGFSEKTSLAEAMAIGIREYIMKPVVKKELAHAVRKALTSKSSKKAG